MNPENIPAWISKAKVKAWDRANIAMLQAFNECWNDIMPTDETRSRDFKTRDFDISEMNGTESEAFIATTIYSLDIFAKVIDTELKANIKMYLNDKHETAVNEGMQDLSFNDGPWAAWLTTLEPLGQCIILDFETTGLDISADNIIEIGLIGFGFPNNKPFKYRQLVNPGKPIDPKATLINGITDGDVKDESPFSSYIPRLRKLFANSTIIGYNIHNYDLPLLDRHVKDAGQSAIKYDHSIDILDIIRSRRSNSLENVHTEFSKQERSGHRAINDCLKCLDILQPILKTFFKREQIWEKDHLDIIACETSGNIIKKRYAITHHALISPPSSQSGPKKRKHVHFPE